MCWIALVDTRPCDVFLVVDLIFRYLQPSAHRFLWSCRFLQLARSATWMLCPRLSCRCREWKGPFAQQQKGRGDRDLVIFEIRWRWVKCSRVHFLEAEKQVELPVARRFSGKQRGPQFIFTHLYPNHPSRKSSICLFDLQDLHLDLGSIRLHGNGWLQASV